MIRGVGYMFRKFKLGAQSTVDQEIPGAMKQKSFASGFFS